MENKLSNANDTANVLKAAAEGFQKLTAPIQISAYLALASLIVLIAATPFLTENLQLISLAGGIGLVFIAIGIVFYTILVGDTGLYNRREADSYNLELDLVTHTGDVGDLISKALEQTKSKYGNIQLLRIFALTGGEQIPPLYRKIQSGLSVDTIKVILCDYTQLGTAIEQKSVAEIAQGIEANLPLRQLKEDTNNFSVRLVPTFPTEYYMIVDDHTLIYGFFRRQNKFITGLNVLYTAEVTSNTEFGREAIGARTLSFDSWYESGREYEIPDVSDK